MGMYFVEINTFAVHLLNKALPIVAKTTAVLSHGVSVAAMNQWDSDFKPAPPDTALEEGRAGKAHQSHLYFGFISSVMKLFSGQHISLHPSGPSSPGLVFPCRPPNVKSLLLHPSAPLGIRCTSFVKYFALSSISRK